MGVKSRVIRAKVCQHGLRAHMQNAYQLLICTCQHVNKRAIVPKVCQVFNLACQLAKGVPIFQIRLPKDVPIFQLFFKRIFQFFNFSIMLNICKFQEYLGNSRKLRKTKKSEFWHLPNFVKEKSPEIHRTIIQLV